MSKIEKILEKATEGVNKAQETVIDNALAWQNSKEDDPYLKLKVLITLGMLVIAFCIGFWVGWKMGADRVVCPECFLGTVGNITF